MNRTQQSRSQTLSSTAINPLHKRSTTTLMLAACALSIAALTGCATQSSSGAVYNQGEARRPQLVEQGVVESVRTVTIQSNPNNVGTATGAVLGGMAGSNLGRGSGRIAGAVVGAVAGGVAGQAIERNVGTKPGLEITVRMDNGSLRAFVQEADEQFRTGERVRIVTQGGTSRVTH